MEDTNYPAPQLSKEQIEAIVDKNGEAYKHDLIDTTFKTRVQGLWAGSGLGMFFGAVIGAVVATAAILTGGAAAVAAAGGAALVFGTVTGAFALTGMTIGALTLTSVGVQAGSAVGQEKIDDRKRLLNDPSQGLADSIRYQGTREEKKTFLNSVLPFHKGSKEIFSVRNALIFGAFAVGAAAIFMSLGGTGMLSAAILPAMEKIGAAKALATFLAGPAVVKAMAFTTAGLFGAFFGVDGPTIAANSIQFVGDVFGGKRLGFGKGKAPAPELPAASPSVTLSGRTSTITPEEAAMLDARLNARDKSFTQAAQQAQNVSISLTPGA